jgi:predicted metalloprotease with PDZ domain
MLAKDVRDPANGAKVVVEFVAENAPAKKAGFMVGDEIVEINSRKVSDNTQLREQTFFIRPSETAVFKVRRNGKIVSLELVTERMASDIVKAAEANVAPSHQTGAAEAAQAAEPQTSGGKEGGK